MTTREQDIQGGLEEEAEALALAKDYRRLPAIEFYRVHFENVSPDEAYRICTKIDQGLETLAILG